MKKSIIAAAAALVAAAGAFAAELTASEGPIVPGEWNVRFASGKAYADANNIPLIVFYGKTDCSECQKMKTALASEECASWLKQRQYVQVLSMKYVAPDWEDARAFIKASLSSDNLPMMCVYWKKADGSVVKTAFVGRSSSMPSSTGKTLQAKFMNSVDKILATGGTDPAPDPVTPDPVVKPVPEFFKKAKTVQLALFDADGGFAGTATVKTGKASSKKLSKISATVELVDGRKGKFTSKKFDVATSDEFRLASALGTFLLVFDGSALNGSLITPSASFAAVSAKFGGALSGSSRTFILQGSITTYKGYDVFGEWLPVGQVFSPAGRWSFPAKGTVKYDSAKNEFVNTGANASALKLAYKPDTGYFKGTFYVYYKASEKKAKKLTAKVTGYVVDGIGYGVATIKGLGSFMVVIPDDLDYLR